MFPRMAYPFDGLRLLLPAMVPSWRFFDAVTASPRIDYALLPGPDAMAGVWQEFRPRPHALSPGQRLLRLFWNASWNETLYLVSLSERLLGATTPHTLQHSQSELLLRVARDLDRHGQCSPDAWLQIRLRLVSRHGPGDRIAGEIAFLSAPCPIADLLTP